MGTNCAPRIADLLLYCYERDFMSDLHKSKRHDLIDMFNDTSRYLDDIFTRAETIRPPHDTIRIAIFTSRFDFFGSIPLTIIKGNKSL